MASLFSCSYRRRRRPDRAIGCALQHLGQSVQRANHRLQEHRHEFRIPGHAIQRLRQRAGRRPRHAPVPERRARQLGPVLDRDFDRHIRPGFFRCRNGCSNRRWHDHLHRQYATLHAKAISRSIRADSSSTGPVITFWATMSRRTVPSIRPPPPQSRFRRFSTTRSRRPKRPTTPICRQVRRMVSYRHRRPFRSSTRSATRIT